MDSASGSAETARSTTSGSTLSAGTPAVAPMGISGAGGSEASGSSVGFTHSLCSGGAVFSTGGGGTLSHHYELLFFILGFSGQCVISHSWGNEICLDDGIGVKAWLYLPIIWS